MTFGVDSLSVGLATHFFHLLYTQNGKKFAHKLSIMFDK
jgi:hypothetical protein